MRTVLQDLRYGARMVRTQPAFSAVVVATLALAIGANTVIFSFANVLLVRPLPLASPQTLGWIFGTDPRGTETRAPVSIPDFLDYRRSLTTFQAVGGSARGSATLTGRGEAERLTVTRVTANLIDIWGLRFVAGRGFSRGSDEPGGPKEVVLSHHYWVNRLNRDPAIVGTSFILDGTAMTVVGVLAPEIEIGNIAEVAMWTPLELSPTASRGDRVMRVSGRLAPGVTAAQASADVRRVAQVLARDHPDTNEGWSARVAPTREAMTGSDTWLILGLLSVVVGFVLLIACANLANLVLARSSARRRELALRTALGASRGRVVRQMLTENVLYGALGGAAGLGVAFGGIAAIKSAAYEPFFQLVQIDRNVLVFTAVLALVTPMLFSLLPALQASRSDVNDALKEGSGRTMSGGRGGRSRSILVVAQLGLAVMLLVVSSLLVQALVNITDAPPGFDTTRLLTFRLDLPAWRYTNDAALNDYSDRLVARLRALPGVEGAATADRLPLLGSEAPAVVVIDGQAAARPEDRPWAVPAIVSPGYFDTAGIAIAAGRGFNEHGPDGQRVAIVNREMARRFWGSPERALGAHITLGENHGASGRYEVIGIAADVLRADREGVNPQVYVDARQQPQRAMDVMVRAADPGSVKAAVRDEARALDRDVPVSSIRTMQEAVNEDLSSSKVLGSMFAAFALVALVLAAAGLYAVVSYAASQRTQEFGVRVALGAVPRDITLMMMRQTALLVLIGVGIGLAGGRALSMAASSLLYRVSPSDPATYAGVAGTLALVAFIATYIPVRRATHIDPVRALRLE